jgi:ribosomal protein L12E/L44/L45/RPP1/RPP2
MSSFGNLILSEAAALAMMEILKSHNPKLGTDLADVVKQDPKSMARPSGPRQGSNQQAGQPKPKAKKSRTQKKKDAASDKREKCSYDLRVPEAALLDILKEAGIDVPEGSTVKLLAKKRVGP